MGQENKYFTTYDGVYQSIFDLCRAKKFPYCTLVGRFKRSGCPEVIDDSFFVDKETWKKTLSNREMKYSYNGVPMTMKEIAERKGVTHAFIKMRIIKTGKTALTDEDLVPMRGTKKPEQQVVIVKSLTNEEMEDRSPGWAERKYFPNAGRNKFHSGRCSGVTLECHATGVIPMGWGI